MLFALLLLLPFVTAVIHNFGLGINLGNTLDAPIEGSWAPVAQEYFFDDWKAAGFTSVRIPIRWDNHTGLTPPYTIDPVFLSRVEEVVGWSLARGFPTVINSHHDDWLDNVENFDAMLPRFQAIWSQVSTLFSNASDLLHFEAFNEPHVMTVAQLNTMLSTFYATVRPNNPTRGLFLGGLEYMSTEWIEHNPTALTFPPSGGPASDENLALEVHSYDPFDFTTPQGSAPPVTEWGTPSDIATAIAILSTRMANWSIANGGAKVLLGEFGCSVLQPNNTARLLWWKTYTEILRNATVPASSTTAPFFCGGTLWDDDGWFQLYNRATRKFDEEVMSAMGL